MPLHTMKDAQDPADYIRQQIGALPKVCGGWILAATYIRPGSKKLQTADGREVEFHFADPTRDEDKWQSKEHLVLAMGNEAYRNDEHRSFVEPYCEIGDWIIITPNSGRMVSWNGVACRLINDVDVQMVVPAPGIAY